MVAARGASVVRLARLSGRGLREHDDSKERKCAVPRVRRPAPAQARRRSCIVRRRLRRHCGQACSPALGGRSRPHPRYRATVPGVLLARARAAGCNEWAVRAMQHSALPPQAVGRSLHPRRERFVPGRPKRTFGECKVDGCDRLACTGNLLCRSHDPAWRRAGRPRGHSLAAFLAIEAIRMREPGSSSRAT